MLTLRYDGRWTETSARNPDSLTMMAPEHLQRICKTFGGTHGIDNKPNFRLVLCESRYQLAGGHNITVLDPQGNHQKSVAAEVFLPRYHVPEPYHGLYVLEMWNSMEQLVAKGYGRDDVEYEGTSAIRCLEPAWADGCYEAVWNGPENPFVFPRSVPTDVIQWAIWLVKLRMSVAADALIKEAKERAAIEDAKNREELLYELKQKRRVNLGDPMISMA